MRQKSYSHFIAVAILSFLPQVQARECALSIVVLDPRTNSEMPYRVHSFRPTVGKDEVGRFQNMRAQGLTCGAYKYELRRSDVETSLGSIQGQLVLGDSHQHLTLEADPTLLITKEGVYAADRFPRDDSILRGAVTGLSPKNAAWVRLLALSGRAREVDVASDGTFEVYDPQPGTYLLLVIQSGKVVAAKQVRVTSTPMTVEIAAETDAVR